MRMYGFVVWSALLLLTAVCAAADKKKEEEPVTLQCGDMTVTLDGERAWTIRQMKYKDFPLLAEDAKTCSGTAAATEKGQWAGSGHGGEKVTIRLLTVDKKRALFKEGATYTAKEKIVFEKKSAFGPFKLDTTIEIHPSRLLQTHEIKREKPGKVEKLYGFMHPFTKEFNVFAAQVWGDVDLAKRFQGAFYGENAKLVEDNARWFGLFCSERHTGVVCWYGGQYKGEEEQTILEDKPEVREYHFRAGLGQEGRAEKLEFTLNMEVVECKTDAFPKTAAKIAGSNWR